jgi:hypothetical protein
MHGGFFTSGRDRRLHVPKGNRIEIPESLKDVVLADISIEDIENGWTEFSAVCDAVAVDFNILTASIISSGDFPLTYAGEAVRKLLSQYIQAHLHRTHPPGVEWLGAVGL